MKCDSNPTVSLVLTTYERPDLAKRAAESMFSQTYDNTEIIIVEDAGDTSIHEWVEQTYEEVTFIRHDQNRGLSAARNTGLDTASGKYVAFLDDDDEWLPKKIEKQVDLLEQSPPRVGLVYCWMDIYEHPNTLKGECHPTLEGDIFKQVLDRQRLCNGSTFLIRTEMAREMEGFDESLSRGVDGDFLRRFCRKYEVRCVKKVLVNYYTEHGNQRMTRDDESGIRNHINGSKVKFEKFDSEMERYPRRAARIHADVAYHHALLGEWGPSLHHFRKSLMKAPHEYRIYLWMVQALLHQVRRTGG